MDPALAPAPAPAPQRAESQASGTKRSKLSTLASSRASTYSTSSTRTGTSDSSSLATYPGLRPSAQSTMSLRPQTTVFSETDGSETSSLVRHAIQTAMDQEAASRGSRASTPSDAGSARTLKAPRQVEASPSRSPAASVAPAAPSGSSGKSMSKLAMLAQAKAAQQQGPWMPKVKTPSQSSSSDSLLHRTHTEYLTPIANGPTATTAITTSYQTLSSLLPPSRSGPPTAPLPAPLKPVTGPSDPPTSKLAMKSRKYKTPAGATVVETEPYYPPAELPIFLPRSSTHSRASPSAFATLLVDDDGADAPKDKEKDARKSRSSEDPSARKHRSSRSRTHQAPTVPQPSASGFAFDVPSPDDIVQNARRGTALAAAARAHSSASSPRSPAKSAR
jgi:hypothetical protein